MSVNGLAAQRAPKSDSDDEILRSCALAKELEAAGQYEAARRELSNRWDQPGKRPDLRDLGPDAQAELLLRAGSLSGLIGSSQQLTGAQEFAKDLISESVRIFEALGLGDKLTDAQVDLAGCYWRAGALDEARIKLNEVLSRTDENSVPRSRAVANLALLERVARRYQDALQIHAQSAPLLEKGSGADFSEGEPAIPCLLEEEVRRYEGALIKRALENSGGSVTRAARLLGITHQGLSFILNGRQRSLLNARKPIRPRRRSIIRYH